MSALGQKRTSALQKGMSALPSKADMCGAARDVRYGPIADIPPFTRLPYARQTAFWYTQRWWLASLRIGRIFSRQYRSLSMAKGTVKWFNPTKGYGFIQPAGGGGISFTSQPLKRPAYEPSMRGRLLSTKKYPTKARHRQRI